MDASIPSPLLDTLSWTADVLSISHVAVALGSQTDYAFRLEREVKATILDED